MTRFFIALMPPQSVQDYAEQVIQELGDRYHTRTAKAPPHVTLQAPFLWELEAIDRLEACLQGFAASQGKVPVKLAGFGAFKPRVLYLNVVQSIELMTLQGALMTELEEQLAIVDAVGKQRGFHPHVTVASRNMTQEVFRQAWAVLQERSIEFEFVSDRLTLLMHDGQRWQVRSEFELLHLY